MTKEKVNMKKNLWQKHATNQMYLFLKRICMKGNTIVFFF